MTKQTRTKLRRRVDAHTVRAMVDCANQGHGCDNSKALRSADRLMEFIEEIIEVERKEAAQIERAESANRRSMG